MGQNEAWPIWKGKQTHIPWVLQLKSNNLAVRSETTSYGAPIGAGQIRKYWFLNKFECFWIVNEYYAVRLLDFFVFILFVVILSCWFICTSSKLHQVYKDILYCIYSTLSIYVYSLYYSSLSFIFICFTFFFHFIYRFLYIFSIVFYFDFFLALSNISFVASV